MDEFTKDRPLKIAVDLTLLRAGGENGGVRPFLFEYVSWLGEQRLVPVKLLILTRHKSHAEVRRLARSCDELICIVEDDPSLGGIRTRAQSPAESAWFDAPPDLVARLGADLLYCPLGMCTWSCPGIPTVATVADLLHRDFPDTLEPEHLAEREAAFQEMVERADRIQVISEYTLSRMSHHYGFPRERTFRTSAAVHHRLRLKVAEDYAEPAGKPYFLYPANAWRHKNHDMLFRAYAAYLDRVGDEAWDLVLTGYDNDAMRRLLVRASSLRLGPKLRFLGYVSEKQFTDVWRNTGALVFPSLHEGFGIPLLEAMAAGIPVISSRSASLPEVGGDACLYADAADTAAWAQAMVRLSRDAALRRELREKGRSRIAAFSFAEDAEHLLRELVNCAQKPARWEAKPDGSAKHRLNRSISGTAMPRSGSAGRLRISVIVPSYNQARYLPTALDSLVAQSYPDLEVKIYDGGSSDGSLDVLKNHPAGYSWMSEPDGGRTEAVNRGFRESTGDIIVIVNSDDILTPGALAAVGRYFEANRDCLAVYGKAHYIDTRGAIMGRFYTEPWNYARLQEVCYLCQPAVFIRREVVEQFGLLDETLRFAPDYEYWLRVGKKVPFHYLQDSVLAGSRRHRNEKKLGQRVYADREILEVILRHGGTPVAVRKWLQYLAHHEAAELAAPSSPVREERRLFMPLFVAAVLKNAARFDIRLSAEWLRELDGQLEAEESQTPVELARE